MIENASDKDIPHLVKLINSAYRGEASRKGWTTEADLISGELRVDDESLRKLFSNKNAIMVVVRNEKMIPACVYLEKQERELYLGMLSVSPEMQGQSLGKRLLAAAEDYARKNELSSIIMNVISKRIDLINWYKRHGYFETGETRPFPSDNKFGIPLEPLEFTVLKKNLT